MEGVMAQAGPHVRLRKGSSIPEELGFLDPELLRRPHRVVCKGGGGRAGTHVTREVVEAQHHDEDHHSHGVLRGHQGQPVGQRRA